MTKRRYKSKWVPMAKEEIRELNLSIYGKRRKFYFKRGFKRSCLGSSTVVVTLQHTWTWSHYLLIEGEDGDGARVCLGGTPQSWENLVFRDAVTSAKKFFDRIGRLEL